MTEKIKLCFVGDIMLGNSSLMLGRGFYSHYVNRDLGYLFSECKDIFKDSDIVFGNLECSISESKKIRFSEPYRSDKRFIKALKKVGFNLINVANNHTMQYGSQGFFSTVDNLLYNDILPIGNSKSNICSVIEIKDKKIGFLSFSLVADNYSTEVEYLNGNQETIAKYIKESKKSVDFLILSLHWGKEHVNLPSPEQIISARNFAESGADLIIGHHPHVVQGFEDYKESLIVYSLGNFIFDKPEFKKRLSMMLEIKIINNDIQYSFIPFFIGSQYRPLPLKGKNKSRFKLYLDRISDPIKDNSYINNIETKINNYKKLVLLERTKNRKNMLKYLFNNIHKYKIRILLYLVFKSLSKRIK